MITLGMLSSDKDDWSTPDDFYIKLDKAFHFDLDPCCTHDNAKCENHYTVEDDGLSKDWSGRRVFMNPPYGRQIWKWVKKAYEESKKPSIIW